MGWIQTHLGAAALGLSAVSAVLGLFGGKITKSICAKVGAYFGKEIAAAESIKTGDVFVDDRLNLSVLCLMEIAHRKMPDSPGADKKKFVMSYFDSASPAIKAWANSAIDALWATMKDSLDRGVTVPQETIIAEAIMKLKALNPSPPAA